MKYLFFVLLVLSGSASANECKDIGELAAKVMKARQNEADVFKTLEVYSDNQEMVLDAYEVPMYDSFVHFKNAMYATNKIIRADENRKHDEVSAKYDSAIAQFKIKYIKACLTK